MFEAWKSNKESAIFSFYLFNVTNEREVLLGHAPQLQEIGPFVYRQFRTYSDVNFSAEQPPRTMHYTETVRFKFIPEFSVAGSQISNIITPDLLHASTLDGPLSNFFSNSTRPFKRITPHEVIWGYKFLGTDIGIMGTVNNSIERFSVDTGAYGIKEVGKVRTRKGKKRLTIWDQEEANIISGTMGLINSPGLNETSVINLYAPLLCRSFEFKSTGKIRSRFREDLELLVFTSEAKNPAIDWSERKYCNSRLPCPPRGMMAIASCIEEYGANVPIYLSSPLFMDSDPRAYSRIKGLRQPNISEHQTYLRVEPTTGITFEISMRTQFNLYMANVHKSFGEMAGPYYMPIAWISSDAHASKSTVDQFQTTVLRLRNLLPVVALVACSISGAIAILLLQALVGHLLRMNPQSTNAFFGGLVGFFCRYKSSVVLQRLSSVESEKSMGIDMLRTHKRIFVNKC